MIDRRLSVAPMLDWTDRFFRYFVRLISRHTLLYSEMVTSTAILHGERSRLLDFDPSERPLALQLGGSEPKQLAESAAIGAEWGYDEINMNVGCPSDRVQSGSFGACLMATPQLVADCVKAMQDRVEIEVTVKHRIGINERDSYAELCDFVGSIAETGCNTFIVHARKAWLQGLSPKQNRQIPPLDYETVYRLKRDFSALKIVINGGIRDLQQVQTHLEQVDGGMIGREAYHNPWLLAQADSLLFDDDQPPPERWQVLEQLLPYIDRQLANGVALNHISRHLLGLFRGCPGAKLWRRAISEQAHLPGAGSDLLRRAAEQIGH